MAGLSIKIKMYPLWEQLCLPYGIQLVNISWWNSESSIVLPRDYSVDLLKISAAHRRSDGIMSLRDRLATFVPELMIVSLPLELQSDQFRAIWVQWIAHRKETRNPLTPTSTKEQLKKWLRGVLREQFPLSNTR